VAITIDYDSDDYDSGSKDDKSGSKKDSEDDYNSGSKDYDSKPGDDFDELTSCYEFASNDSCVYWTVDLDYRTGEIVAKYQ